MTTKLKLVDEFVCFAVIALCPFVAVPFSSNVITAKCSNFKCRSTYKKSIFWCRSLTVATHATINKRMTNETHLPKREREKPHLWCCSEKCTRILIYDLQPFENEPNAVTLVCIMYNKWPHCLKTINYVKVMLMECWMSICALTKATDSQTTTKNKSLQIGIQLWQYSKRRTKNLMTERRFRLISLANAFYAAKRNF